MPGYMWFRPGCGPRAVSQSNLIQGICLIALKKVTKDFGKENRSTIGVRTGYLPNDLHVSSSV